MSNEEEYWIINTVCTYRDFGEPSPPDFDGEKFFHELRKEMAKEREKALNNFIENHESLENEYEEEKANAKNCKIVSSSSMTKSTTTQNKNNLNEPRKIIPSVSSKQKNIMRIPSTNSTKTNLNKPILPSLLFKNESIQNIKSESSLNTEPINKNNYKKYIIPVNNQVTYTTKTTTTTKMLTPKTLNPTLRRSYSFDRKLTKEPTFLQHNYSNKILMRNQLKPTNSFIFHQSDPPKCPKLRIKRSASLGPDSKPSFLNSKIKTTFVETSNIVTKIKDKFKISNDRIKSVVERLTRQKMQTYNECN